MKIFRGRPDGFYIRYSSSCGEDSAVRLYYVQESDETVTFCFSVNEAVELGKELIKIAHEYEDLYSDGSVEEAELDPDEPKLVYKNE